MGVKAADEDLIEQKKWQLLAYSDHALWGYCKGRQSSFLVMVDLSQAEVAFSCSCPRHESPCKHGLALLYNFVNHREWFKAEPEPAYVTEWLDKRAVITQKNEQRHQEKIEQAKAALEQAADGDSKTNSATIDGLAELKVWLQDCLRVGFQAMKQRVDDINRLSKLLIDAQAPALADMLQVAKAIDCSTLEGQRQYLKQLSHVYFIITSLERRESLTPQWQSEIARLVGLTIPTKEEVIAAARVANYGQDVTKEAVLVLTDVKQQMVNGTTHRQLCYLLERQSFVTYFTFVPENAQAGQGEQPLPLGAVFSAKVYPYPGLKQVPRVLLEERELKFLSAQPKMVYWREQVTSFFSFSQEDNDDAAHIEAQNLLKNSALAKREQLGNGDKHSAVAAVDTEDNAVYRKLVTQINGCPDMTTALQAMGQYLMQKPFADYAPEVIDHVNFAQQIKKTGNTWVAKSSWFLCDRDGLVRQLSGGDAEQIYATVVSCLALTGGAEFTAVVLLNEATTILCGLIFNGRYYPLPLSLLAIYEDHADKTELDATAGTDLGKGEKAEAASAEAQQLARVQQHQGPLPVSLCPPEPEGQRYLPPEIMAALERQSNNNLAWMAILSRLYGTGLKVPPEQAVAFLRINPWFGWNQRRPFFPVRQNPLYGAVNANFLSVRAVYLMPYVKGVWWPALMKPRFELLDGDYVAGKQNTAAAGKSLSALLSERILRQRGKVSCFDADHADDLLAAYQFGYLLDWLEALEANEQGLDRFDYAKLFDILCVYWRRLWTHFFLKGEQVPVAAIEDENVQAASADHKQLSLRLVSWLWRVANSAKYNSARVYANAMLRLVPRAQWEQEVVALVRRCLVVTNEQGETQCSWLELNEHDAQLGRILLQEWPNIGWLELNELELNELNEHDAQLGRILLQEWPNIGKLGTSDEYELLRHQGYDMSSHLIFAALSWYVPPALWFEIFKLERSGDEVQDAERLFTLFARIFPGWEVLHFYFGSGEWWWGERYGRYCVPYFIARVGCELGAVYTDAFYRHCGSLLYDQDKWCSIDIVEELVAQVSTAEREQLPFVLAPERYQGLLAPFLRDWSKTLRLLDGLVLEPEICWGPKFSQFYWYLLGDIFVPESCGQLRVAHFFTKHFNIVAWMLDPQVRTAAIVQLKKQLSMLQGTLVNSQQEDTPYMKDDDFQKPQQAMCYCLRTLLSSMQEAERVQHMCAQLQEQCRT